MIKGVLFALAACLLWGLIFIVPTFMTDFDAFEIALGRHFVFGSVSTLFLAVSFNTFKRYPFKIWKTALYFSLIANIVYYSCVVLGVNCASPSLTALILGMSPIVISFYGNWLEQDCHYRDLAIPAILIFLGLFFVNIPALQQEGTEEKPLYWVGALAACISLVAWSWFVVKNARFLKNNPEVAPAEWSTLMGTSTFTWVLLLGTLYESWQGGDHWQQFTTPSLELKSFVIGCLVLGVVCSWIGSYLWNNASMRLPVSFAGELTIFETIFGLIFFYCLEQKLPSALEAIGVTLMLSAVFYSMGSTVFAREKLTQV